MKVVPDVIEIPLKAKDANWEVEFVVGFKLIDAKIARLLLKKLINSSYEKQVSILLSNIVYLDKVALGSGNLTNSFETDIMKSLLASFPYFKTLLANYVSILQNMEHIQRRNLQEQNLFEIGKYQYEKDNGKQDADSKRKEETKELQESLGEFMNFDDEPKKEVTVFVKEQLTAAKLPDLLWKSNLPYLELFNIAKLYRNEWGIINPVIIIELAKEAKLKISDTLSFISLLFAGYESMKPEKT